MKSLVTLALLALICAAILPQAAMAQRSGGAGSGVTGQGQYYSDHQYNQASNGYSNQAYRRGGGDCNRNHSDASGNILWALGGFILGRATAPHDHHQCFPPCGQPVLDTSARTEVCERVVVIHDEIAPQPVQPPVVVQQQTTVVVNDRLVDSAPCAPETSAVQPTCVTGPVILAPWGMNITVPQNKPLSVGTQLWFIGCGKVIGKYTVKAICGQTVTVGYLCGDKPNDGDGFAIVYPQ